MRFAEITFRNDHGWGIVPTFDQLTIAGAVVNKSKEAHTILDDMFLISGEIPRLTPYETGLKNAVRYDPEENDWYSDELIADERFLACNVKGEHYTPSTVIAKCDLSKSHLTPFPHSPDRMEQHQQCCKGEQ